MSAFLTPDEIVVLTGYKRAADQIRRLQRAGIPHLINRLGKPVVWRDQSANQKRLGEKQLGEVR
jgi:hypothetical protein